MAQHDPYVYLVDTPSSSFTARLYWFAGILSVCFVLTAVFVQMQRLNQPALSTPISDYLSGPEAGWLRAAFYLVGVSVALFGLAVRRTIRSGWSVLVLLLLVVCALSVAMTTWSHAPWPLPLDPVDILRVRLHFFSAVTAFVCALLAMICMTAMLWHNKAFQSTRVIMTLLMLTVLITLILDPLLDPLQGGLEKLVIVEMIAWQLIMIRHLSVRPRPVVTGEVRMD